MDEMKQMQDEFEQELEIALDLVEAGYITKERMAIIRYACGVVKQNNATFNFDEIFGEKK